MPKPFWDRNTSRNAQREIAANAAALGVDPKALNVLYNTYCDIDVADSRLPGKPVETPAADLQYAIDAGVMRPSEELDHDALVDRLIALRDSLDRHRLAGAFVTSLRSGRLDLRSSLGSYAYHLHHSDHALDAHHLSGKVMTCTVCDFRDPGEEPKKTINYNSAQMMRLRLAGGVTHRLPNYALADLTWFASDTPPEPDAEDWSLFRTLLDTIRGLPADARATTLEKTIGKLFKSNRLQRQFLLEILGYCGILQPKTLPPVHERYFHLDDRSCPPRHANLEWLYPVSWWCGADGVSEEAVRFWFPRAAA